MRKISPACLTVAVLFVISAQSDVRAEATTVGNASTVVRTVTGELEAELRSIKLLDDLYHNEIIETGEDSATEIIFLDETNLSMGPSSSLVLDKFVYDPDPTQASFIVTATQGVFRFATGNLPKKSYVINTPTATIGIRGTVFDLIVSPESDSGIASVSLSLVEGEANIVDCSGGRITLTDGHAAVVVAEKENSACRILKTAP
jgi:hypothetical protein